MGVKGICRNGGPSLPGPCRVTDFEVGSHRILTVATARNPGSYIFGSSISSLKLSFDSKKIQAKLKLIHLRDDSQVRAARQLL